MDHLFSHDDHRQFLHMNCQCRDTGHKFLFSDMIVLTNILAIFLIIAGVIRSVNAFILKPLIGWGWILLSGLLTLATGIIILMSPDAPFWVLGLFLAVDILFQGVNYLTLAAAIKRIPKSSADV